MPRSRRGSAKTETKSSSTTTGTGTNSLRKRSLRLATRLAARLLPKEVQSVVRKYKKYRSGSQSSLGDMPKKDNKKGGATPAPLSDADVDAVARQLENLIVSGTDTPSTPTQPNPTSPKTPTSTTMTSVVITEQRPNEQNRQRFDGYNERLEELFKIREALAKKAKEGGKLSPDLSIKIEEVVQKSTAFRLDQSKEIDEKDDRIAELEAQLRDEKAKNASLAAQNRDLANMNDKLDNKNNELENALRAKDKELQNALKRIKELEDLILKKDADLDDLMNKNKALKDDLKKKNNELQVTLAELQRLTLTSDSQTSELQIKIKDKDDEIARMYAALDKIEKDFHLSLEAKKREMDEINKLTMTQYHRDLDDLKDQLQIKDKEILELKIKIAELQKQMAQLQQENCTLKAQLGEANKTKDDKDKELGDTKAQLEMWRKRHADLVNDLQNAKIKLVADDLEPQFQKYDGLLKLEESRLGVPVGGRGVDQNNNRM